MTESHALKVTELSYSYGSKKALEGVSFDMPGSCFVALLGANGAGKTTIFALLTRLLSPMRGKIEIGGILLSKNPGMALKQMGVVFQQSSLDMDLSVRQNLHYHAALHGIDRKTANARIEQELSRFNMLDRIEHKIRALNQGHRRRVEIARALLHQPRLLLLDEATVGLDIDSRQMINQHVRELSATQNVSVLWASHLIDDIEFSDRMILLDEGRIVAQGLCQEVLDQHGQKDLRSLMLKYGRKKT